MYDIIFKNAWIADGSGKPCFKACVGVKDGKIAKIGELCGEEAARVIELTEEQVLSPGFFDIHSHNDLLPMIDPNMTPQVLQGVTYDIAGNCGQSFYPVSEDPELAAVLENYTGTLVPMDLVPYWRQFTSFKKYREHVEAAKPRIRLGHWLGQGSIRIAVMGMQNRNATPEELEKMKAYVREGMENGALGISTGLVYIPGAFTPEEEIVELAKVAAEYGGVYATHIRDECDRVVEAVEEAIRIAKKSGCKLLISHHKIMADYNKEKYHKTLALMDEARASGMTVICDQYLYNYGATLIAALFPPVYQEGGNEALLGRVKDPKAREEMKKVMENDRSYQNYCVISGGEGILIVEGTRTHKYDGKNMAEIAEEMGVPFCEAICRVYEENEGAALIAIRIASEESIEGIWKYPYTAGGSDGIGAGIREKTHPRAYAAFVRIFEEYVRKRHIVSLEEAVRKLTSLPADFLGLKDVGRIQEGCLADIVVFNRNTIGSEASFAKPKVDPTGVDYVFVGGEPVVEYGKIVPRK
jgi:N-acyl-D-amino-acid deacylase